MKINMDFIAHVLDTVANSVSKELKEAATGMLDKLEEKAKATKNPFDDIAVKTIRGITGL